MGQSEPDRITISEISSEGDVYGKWSEDVPGAAGGYSGSRKQAASKLRGWSRFAKRWC